MRGWFGLIFPRESGGDTRCVAQAIGGLVLAVPMGKRGQVRSDGLGAGRGFRWCGGTRRSDRGHVVGWGRHSGGVALLNHRLQAGTSAGVRFHFVWFPVVSLVPSSTTG